MEEQGLFFLVTFAGLLSTYVNATLALSPYPVFYQLVSHFLDQPDLERLR